MALQPTDLELSVRPTIDREVATGRHMGFAGAQEFPITVDGMPLQLLSYLRMARIQNSAEIAKVFRLKSLQTENDICRT